MMTYSVYQPRRIRSIRKNLSTSLAINLTTVRMLPRIDYCNSLLYGVWKAELNCLRSGLNATAKIILCRRKFDHVAPQLRNDLHWLRQTELIIYKQCHFSSIY